MKYNILAYFLTASFLTSGCGLKYKGIEYDKPVKLDDRNEIEEIKGWSGNLDDLFNEFDGKINKNLVIPGALLSYILLQKHRELKFEMEPGKVNVDLNTKKKLFEKTFKIYPNKIRLENIFKGRIDLKYDAWDNEFLLKFRVDF